MRSKLLPMKLSERSYPYPVIGNRDDVPGASFQATIDVAFDAETVFIDVLVATSSRTLIDLVDSEAASFAVHVECSNTLYRAVQRSTDAKFRFAISKEYLNDTVEVNVVAIAAQDIEGYSVDGQHAEYGQHSFSVRKGDILAVYPSQQFTVERDFTSFKNIDSIVTLIPAPDDSDRPMSVQYEDDKIVIMLARADFRQYGLVRNSSLAPLLAATIVLPVVMEAVRILRDSPEEMDFRWCRAIAKRLEELEVSLRDDDPLIVAQRLLELPIKRALSCAASAQDGE